MYDIVFIGYKEEEKEKNWQTLVSKFPTAKRVDGVVTVGVSRPGLALNTRDPVPVSLDITPANCAEVVDAITEVNICNAPFLKHDLSP
jgi:hypothetical protein